MRLRLLCVSLVILGSVLLTPTDAKAQSGSCYMYFWGDVYDVFDNVIWSTHDYDPEYVHFGTLPDIGTCTSEVIGIADWYSYHVCLARSAGVTVDYQTEMYFNGNYITTLPFADSCRDDWGLNYYNVMTGGQSLYPTDTILSPSNQYALTYQSDANLVVYDGSTPVWAINCWHVCENIGSAGVATMQTDGNFVVYDSNSNPVWDSNTDGYYGAYLAIRDSGQLVVYDTGGIPRWISHH